MRRYFGAISMIGASVLALSSVQAAAQTGEELLGQTVDVAFSDGSTNSVYFGSNGQAQITSSNGESANANWFARDRQICLQTGGTAECWAYEQRFEAGQSLALASTCNETSQWTARSVNPIRQEVAPMMQGERG